MATDEQLEAACARNDAACAKLQDEATTASKAAYAAMLAAAVEAARREGFTADDVASAAADGWSRGVDRIRHFVEVAFRRLAVDRLGNLPREDGTPGWRTVRTTLRRKIRAASEDHGNQVAKRLARVPEQVAQVAQREMAAAQGQTEGRVRSRVVRALRPAQWSDQVEQLATNESAAVFNASQSSGVDIGNGDLNRPLQKRWISRQDEKVRPSHRQAHGQTVAPDEAFTVGGSRLRFPGDPTAPPGETAGCRCTVAVMAGDDVVDVSDRLVATAGEDMSELHVLVALTRMPPALLRYWTRGEGAAKVGWGPPGDFNRCRRNLREYVNPAQLDGLCANLHKVATGTWPGDQNASADERGIAMPCGCEDITDEDVDRMIASLTGDDDLPLAPLDAEFDPQKARRNIADWATNADGLLDMDRYARGFLWHDDDADSSALDGYRYPFADVIDGELTAVPRAIMNYADALHAGELDVPDAAQDDLRDQLTGWFAKVQRDQEADFEAPWDLDEGDSPAGGDDEAADDPEDTPEDGDEDGDEGDDTGDGEGVTAALPEAPDTGNDDTGTGPRDTNAEPADNATDQDESDSGSQQHTGGMVALIPTQQDAERLSVDGGDPADELHVTLMFLGDESDWDDTERDTLTTAVESAAQNIQPATGTTWAATAINPTSDDPCCAYLVSDDNGVNAAHQAVVDAVESAGVTVPEQHSPWVPHITTRWQSTDTTGLDQFGPVEFDRIRVSFGGTNHDIPLNPSNTTEDDPNAETPDETPTPPARTENGPDQNMPADTMTLAAAVDASQIIAQAVTNAPTQPAAESFGPRELNGPTPITVTANGDLYGHIALWDSCHRGISGECVTPPRSRIDYAAFHQYPYPNENAVASVGFLLAGCDHAPVDADEPDARSYHEAACTRVAAVKAYEDPHGIAVSGTLVPGATEQLVADLRHISGEWRAVSLELMAAVGVPDPGYPVADANATTVAVAASADTGEGYEPNPTTERARSIVAHIPLIDDDHEGTPAPGQIDEVKLAETVADVLEARAARKQQRQRVESVVTAAKRSAIARQIDRYKKTRGNA